MKRPKTQCVFIKLESGFEPDSKLRVTVTSNPPVKAPVKLNPAINVATQVMTAIRQLAQPPKPAPGGVDIAQAPAAEPVEQGENLGPATDTPVEVEPKDA